MKKQTLQRQFRIWTILLIVVPSILIMIVYTVGQFSIAKQQRLELISRQVEAQGRLIIGWKKGLVVFLNLVKPRLFVF